MFKFFLLFAFFTIGFGAVADDIHELCHQDIEGSYKGTLDNFPVFINLVCIDGENLSASVAPGLDLDSGYSYNLVSNLSNASIDGDDLIISNFALENKDRPAGSSKSLVSYVSLDLKSLLAGQLKGYFMSGGMADFQEINATRVQKFPDFKSLTKAPLPAKFHAAYATDMPDDKTVNLIFNILLGTPVISVAGVYNHFVIHFTEGPLWNPDTGVFSSVTSEGNGGEPDDKKLYYLRGRFLNIDHVEFYLINPIKGVRGPFHGKRIVKSLPPKVSNGQMAKMPGKRSRKL